MLILLIVDPHQLTQGIVFVRGRYIVPGLARYVAPVIIRVCQVERVRSAALGYAGDQGSGGVAAVRGITLHVPVRRIVFDAVRYLPAGDTVKLVIYIAYLCIRASITSLIELGFAS